jgi:hypothetical protein
LTGRPDPLAPPEGYGRKPGQEPDAVDSPTCTHNEGKCGQPSRWRFMLGDESEHIARLNMCDEHARQMGGFSTPWRWQCLMCKKEMRLERIEPMDGQPLLELTGQWRSGIQAAIDGLGARGWAS